MDRERFIVVGMAASESPFEITDAVKALAGESRGDRPIAVQPIGIRSELRDDSAEEITVFYFLVSWWEWSEDGKNSENIEENRTKTKRSKRQDSES